MKLNLSIQGGQGGEIFSTNWGITFIRFKRLLSFKFTSFRRWKRKLDANLERNIPPVEAIFTTSVVKKSDEEKRLRKKQNAKHTTLEKKKKGAVSFVRFPFPRNNAVETNNPSRGIQWPRISCARLPGAIVNDRVRASKRRCKRLDTACEERTRTRTSSEDVYSRTPVGSATFVRRGWLKSCWVSRAGRRTHRARGRYTHTHTHTHTYTWMHTEKRRK